MNTTATSTDETWINRVNALLAKAESTEFEEEAEALMAKAQELAGDRVVEVAAGDVGGQVLAAGLVDEVRMDVAPVVMGSGKRFFGSVSAQHLLDGPDDVVQGDRVLHLTYRVRRP